MPIQFPSMFTSSNHQRIAKSRTTNLEISETEHAKNLITSVRKNLTSNTPLDSTVRSEESAIRKDYDLLKSENNFGHDSAYKSNKEVLTEIYRAIDTQSSKEIKIGHSTMNVYFKSGLPKIRINGEVILELSDLDEATVFQLDLIAALCEIKNGQTVQQEPEFYAWAKKQIVKLLAANPYINQIEDAAKNAIVIWGKMHIEQGVDAYAYLQIDREAVQAGFYTADGFPDRLRYVQQEFEYENWHAKMDRQKMKFVQGLIETERQFIRKTLGVKNPAILEELNKIEDIPSRYKTMCDALSSQLWMSDKGNTQPNSNADQYSRWRQIFLCFEYLAANFAAVINRPFSSEPVTALGFSEFILKKIESAESDRLIWYAKALTDLDLTRLVIDGATTSPPFSSWEDKWVTLALIRHTQRQPSQIRLDTQKVSSQSPLERNAIDLASYEAVRGLIEQTYSEQSLKLQQTSRFAIQLAFNHVEGITEIEKKALTEIGFQVAGCQVVDKCLFDFRTNRYKMVCPLLRYLLVPESARDPSLLDVFNNQYSLYMAHKDYYDMVIRRFYLQTYPPNKIESASASPVSTITNQSNPSPSDTL